MSAFQDFGPLSERRKAEKQQRRRKTFMIAGASLSVLVLLLGIGAAAVVYQSNNNSGDSSKTATGSAKPSTNELHSGSKSTIRMLCSSTNFQETCESSLTKAAANLSSSSSPKDLIRVAVTVVFHEIDKAFDRFDHIHTEDPRVKGAIASCKRFLDMSKDELLHTVSIIDAHSLDDFPAKVKFMANWLSSVMTNQETCVEEFPEGEAKKKMEEGLQTARELSNNALTIVVKASSLLSILQIPGLDGRRHLLSEERDFHDDGYPAWISNRDRRFLRGSARKNLTPNITVAKDGSGNFTTINAALEAIPKDHDESGRFFIYVKAGTYKEYVVVTKKKANLTMYGDGSRKTIVTGSLTNQDCGGRTYDSATFKVEAPGFMCMGMGFQNTAGPHKEQAVALAVKSEESIFLNCRMDGYQDTLYVHSLRQYYRSCVITGTIDFIFGNAVAVFQNCVMQVLRPLDSQQNIVTAHGRSHDDQPTAIIIHNCRIVADPSLDKDKLKIRSYLGRPWRNMSRTIIMESEINDFIHPDGYMPWDGDFALDTLYYAEYSNNGAGADVSRRVKWPGFNVIGKQQAEDWTADKFLNLGQYISKTGQGFRVPARMKLYH